MAGGFPVVASCVFSRDALPSLRDLSCHSVPSLYQALPYVALLIVMMFFIYAVIGMQVRWRVSNSHNTQRTTRKLLRRSDSAVAASFGNLVLSSIPFLRQETYSPLSCLDIFQNGHRI